MICSLILIARVLEIIESLKIGRHFDLLCLFCIHKEWERATCISTYCMGRRAFWIMLGWTLSLYETK